MKEDVIFLSSLSSDLGKILYTLLKNETPNLLCSAKNDEHLKDKTFQGVIPWNIRSPISSHSIILECLKRYRRVDRALILFEPDIENRPIHDLPAAAIEQWIDINLKGLVYIIKEFINLFMKQGFGALNIILTTNGSDVLTSLNASIYGGMRELTNSLFTFYRKEPFSVNGFESGTSNLKAYAEYILKTIKETPEKRHGKWFRFSEKSVFLQNFTKTIMGSNRQDQ